MPGFYKVSVQIDSVLHHRLTSDSLFVVPVQADALENLRLTVYPNPTKEILHWSIQGFHSATIHLHIFDALGQTIRQKTEVLHTGQLSLSNLSSGTYYLEFHVDGEVVYRCIRKE